MRNTTFAPHKVVRTKIHNMLQCIYETYFVSPRQEFEHPNNTDLIVQITGHNHQVIWPVNRSMGQSVNQPSNQSHSRNSSLAHCFTHKLTLYQPCIYYESTLIHSLLCLSVFALINQSVGQSTTSQPISATQVAARSLVCSPVHPHTVTVS